MAGEQPPRRPIWQRLVGDLDRVGWSVLPLFLIVGLAGAVLAGALAAVYYSQQVVELENETRDARANLEQAVTDVEDAAEVALGAIESEVEAVREIVNQSTVIEDIGTLGLVVVQAQVNSPAPPEATVTEGQEPTTTDPGSSPAPAEQAQASNAASEPAVTPRFGVGFAVASDAGEVFFATAYDVVVDEQARAGVVEEVVVWSPAGEPFPAVVHSWDENRGLALLRAQMGGMQIPRWRSSQTPLNAGQAITLVGMTPQRAPVQLESRAGFVDATAIVTDLGRVDFLRGAPVLDRDGNVVAVYTPGYQPFGPAAGQGQAIAPVALLCETMLNGCDGLEADPATDGETPDDAGPDGASPQPAG